MVKKPGHVAFAKNRGAPGDFGQRGEIVEPSMEHVFLAFSMLKRYLNSPPVSAGLQFTRSLNR